MANFKKDDVVYMVSRSRGVIKTKILEDRGVLIIERTGQPITPQGMLTAIDKIPYVFHDTEKNRALLSQLYDLEA